MRRMIFLVLTITMLPATITPGSRQAVAGNARVSGSVTFTPTPIPLSDPDVVNPMRGLYTWHQQQLAPVASYDSYDRFTWSDLEPNQGVYDFSKIDAALSDARSRGGKFGFRVMALWDQHGSVVPQYVMTHTPNLGYWYDYKEYGHGTCDPVLGGGSCDTYVPDWNDPFFLGRVSSLLTALGRRYNSDPRLGFVDVGLYGDFGEWHMYGFPYVGPTGAKLITVANKDQIIDMHVNAFPNKFILMATSDYDGLAYAMAKSPKIGWRRDSLGHADFDTVWSNRPYHAATNLAVTSPVYSGNAAASFTLTGQWGEIAFHVNKAFDVSPDTAFHFAAQAGQATSNLVAILGNNGTTLGRVSLAAYGGQPVQGAWKVYDIPFSAIDPTGARVTDVIIQDQTGQASNLTYYVDEVGFNDGPGTVPYLIYDDDLTGAWNNLITNRWKAAPIVTEFWGSYSPGTDLTLANSQEPAYHVSMVSNGNYNVSTWSALSPTEQANFLQTGKTAGYRLTLRAVTLPAQISGGVPFTLTSQWSNDGIAPVYEPWNVSWQLRSTGTPTQIAWQSNSTLNLTSLLPTNGSSSTVNDILQLPNNLPSGSYQLSVQVLDPSKYRAPLALAIQGRQSDGSYLLGTVTVIPQAYFVYQDALASGWANRLYHAATNLAVTSPVYSGNDATSFTLTGQWGEIDFHSSSPFDITPYNKLHFAAQAGQATSNLVAILRNNGTTLGRVSLAGYGGQPVQGAWKVYDIPFSAIDPTAMQVTDVIIQDQTGQSANLTYYVDEVGFTR
jgi:hypothetical protein